MKRILAVALMTLFVLGLAATVYADVTINGDMRVRGIWKSNFTDLNSDNPDAQAYWDQRLRLGFDAKKGDAQVVARMTVSEGTWGSDTDPIATGVQSDTYGNVILDNDDLAYMVVPVGPGKLTIGRQHASWGNKFLTWERGVDRAKYTMAMGDMTVGAFTDKARENGIGVYDDYDTYGALVIAKSGDMSGGVLLTYNKDNALPTKNTGGYIDVYGNAKMDAISIAGEIAYGYGDLSQDAAGNQKMGGFVQASMSMDALTVAAAAAYAANGQAASNHFTPTNLFGTSQATAFGEFGSSADNSTWAVVGVVSFKASDALTAGGKVAYASWSGFDWTSFGGPVADTTVLEVDADVAYTISEGVVWSANFAWGSVDVDGVSDLDSIMTATHKIEVKF